ncbi:MAG TPA: ketoacyl-ACP synthase III [Thermoanaerobaculia bacterium]|nr:ketoacyl-ACP synthase III [Thermoanaerobaculia bacterium]
MTRYAALQALAYYLPESELTNETLAGEFEDWTADKILEKTGISCRRIAAPEECSSDLGVSAAEALFEGGTVKREDIDFLLFCTQSPDYFLPATACIVQAKLGLRTDCGAIDFNQGCSGFVYGLALAKSLVEGLGLNNVLLITAETYSKFIHPRDRSVRTIFGDAAAATLISAVEAEEPLLGPFVFGTDGRGAGNLIVPAGGMRLPVSETTSAVEVDNGGNARSKNNLYMNGPEIFNFTLKAVPAAVNALLAKANVAREDVDYYVLHQANRFMLDRLRDKMKIDPSRFCLEMEDCGNTVSSTIPIALARSQQDGRLSSGARVMNVGFGVGYSWAAGMMRVP